jgi:hypothetical protein
LTNLIKAYIIFLSDISGGRERLYDRKKHGVFHKRFKLRRAFEDL